MKIRILARALSLACILLAAVLAGLVRTHLGASAARTGQHAPVVQQARQTLPDPSAANQVTEITLQRTWCFGRCPVDEVVLNADGTAKYTGEMNTERTGQYKSTFWKGDFERLAQWLESEGYFALKDSYGEPNTDSPDQIISAVRGSQRKRVSNHSGDSLKLWGMERAIRGAAFDIAWQPEPSGIHGVVTWRPKVSSEFPGPPAFRPLSNATVTIRPADHKQAFMIRTDENGKFAISLRPGTYSVEMPIFKQGPQQTAVVQPGKFSDMTIKIDRLTGQPKP